MFILKFSKCSSYTWDEDLDTDGFMIHIKIGRLVFEPWFTWVKKRAK